ncbi:MAG: 50S ribosomal protein L24 [Myxococcota bacterium]
MMRIRVGDSVKVIAGSHKNHVGKVVRLCGKAMRVEVEGLPGLKRHLKAGRHPKHSEGGIVEKPRSVHISNVMLMFQELKRPVRTGIGQDESGKKARVARGRNVQSKVI